MSAHFDIKDKEISALRTQTELLITHNEALRSELAACRNEIVHLTRLLEEAQQPQQTESE